jgi:hypothetical protein
MCKKAGLTFDEMDQLTIGGCLDFVDEFIEQSKPSKPKARQASQADFDKF